MADKIKCTLLKPLNGAPIGSDAEYSPTDFQILKAKGAVKAKAEKSKGKKAK